MPKENKTRSKGGSASPAGVQAPDSKAKPPVTIVESKEIGGRDGLDPTRYGDWEKNGRCVDF